MATVLSACSNCKNRNTCKSYEDCKGIEKYMEVTFPNSPLTITIDCLKQVKVNEWFNIPAKP